MTAAFESVPVGQRFALACLAAGSLVATSACGKATAVAPEAGAGSECTPPGSAAVGTAVLGGKVPSCADGYAHPNVCCAAGPNRAAGCTEDPNRPFGPCACASFTFPDPRTCCSLETGGDCQDAPLDAGAPVGLGDCFNPCSPSDYSAKEVDSGSPELPACSDVPNEVWDAGFESPASGCLVCCGPAGCGLDVSGCGSLGGCTPLNFCPPCPSGWAMAQGFPDVCCRSAAGAEECYSRASLIATSP
jgi:hypothetical protein